MLRDLGRNLVSGAYLAFLLPTNRRDFKSNGEQAFLLLVLLLTAILIVELISSSRVAEPATDRIGFYGLAVLAGLGGCLITLHLLRAADSLGATAIMLLTGTLWIVIAVSPILMIAGAGKLAPSTMAGRMLGVVIGLWFLVVAARTMRCVASVGLSKATALALVLALSVAAPELLLSDMSRWTMTAAKLPPHSLQENLYYGQFGMMDRAASWLQPHRDGVTDLYFIGFAADAREGVFLNEMRSVAQLFDERFDTSGRSMVLLNNRQTVRQVPLANAHNLGRALTEVGKRIDANEDILFLYISAPALRNAEFTPKFEPLDFVPIHAANIRHMMDDAEVQWRVVVLSTCVGDEFLKRVQTVNSLVIVAASQDGDGHGCSGDADYTYFGKAFFDDALKRGFSFTQAFETAAKALAEREQSEGRRPSRPRMYVGAGIAEKLDMLSARLQAAHAARATVADRPVVQ
ncbi:MAG: hypothetical protein MJE12_24720 [Alphaproteobacteria bacterium]|nr:hypothetical protein [Alphaproteobacteria bacterium]